MNANSMKNLGIIFITLSCGLLSCDEYSTYSFEIENNSSDTIRIYFTGATAYTNGADSVVVNPNNNNIYYESEGRKIKSKNFNCYPQISENETAIKTSSQRVLKKSIWDEVNWICETDNDNTYYRLIFTITESDLELHSE